MIAAAAAVGLAALVGGVLVAGDDGGREGAAARPAASAAPSTTAPARSSTSTAPARPTTAPAPPTTAPADPAVANPAVASPAAPQGPAAPVPVAAAPAAVTGLPTDPASYATAAFDAWLHGREGRLRKLVSAPVADLLAALTPHDSGGWSGPVCEGAAGSTSCTWAGPGARLTLSVADQAAARGGRHAVTEAVVTPPAGGVAVWPFTTAEQAADTQAAFDAGHQPWLGGPESVALAYAGAELGWPDAVIDSEDPEASTLFRLTDPATLAVVDVTMAQPARQGLGGIWAVVRVESAG